MTAVSAIFGTVHGITLAFGFTLIGVAQDYPLHLLSHRQPDREPVAIARGLWPTLATGVASTCIAYLTFLFSGVNGLAQLACFTVVALAVAGATTRFALPALMDRSSRDFGASPFLGRLWNRIAALPRMRWTALALAAIAIAAIAFAPQLFWENDLSRLTPVPRDLLLADQQLRSELGAADARYLLVVEAGDSEDALRKLEALEPSLQELLSSDVIGGFDHAARYVPSAQTQQRRQQRLPATAALREAVERAQAGTPFRAGIFEPFVQDVEQARALQPLTVEALRSSPLGASVDTLLTQGDAGVTALVTLSGVQDLTRLHEFAQRSRDNLRLLDIKIASEELVAAQRTRILWTLAAAAVLLVAVIAVALRSRSRVFRVLAPMALTTLLVLAVLRVSGVSLNLFHLIALVLAAGLGLDYALFFEHASTNRGEQRRTLHAVLVCSLSTLMVFALLGLSDIPVLRAIGVTVTLGVIFNFLFALLLTRPPPDRTPSPAELIPHTGTMCLLERVVEWDERRIVLETASHRSRTNPLRVNERLRAVNLCEYGAQAMAVHGGLRGTVTGVKPKPGMLVSLRSVQLGREYVEDLPGDLRVEAECLQADAASLQYRFRIVHGAEIIAEGRAAVVLAL
jgi:predicted exporter/predicted hotdog family 3-hydroxylacyl-ACP dehydratase